MTKKRIIGVVVVKDGLAVQSIGFQKYLPVGKPEIAIEYLNRWGIDEILVLHIDATNDPSQRPSASQVKSYCKNALVPLAVGGGIKTTDHAREIIQAGADKVVLNSALYENAELITQTGKLFGHQSVVVSIDFKNSSGKFTPLVRVSGSQKFEDLSQACLKAQALGAGELLLNSVDNDGGKSGLELSVFSQLTGISIPRILCGGAGHPEHLVQGLKVGFDAVGAANFFHYYEHSVILTKRYLKVHDQDVRLDSYADYKELPTTDTGRVPRASDDYLDHLRFRYVPEENI